MFGDRVATIHYRDITGIEVNVGMIQGVIEISTASYPAKGKKSVWKGSSEQDPYLESNCLPIVRHHLKSYESHLAELRRRIDVARDASAGPRAPTAAASGEVEASAALAGERFLLRTTRQPCRRLAARQLRRDCARSVPKPRLMPPLWAGAIDREGRSKPPPAECHHPSPAPVQHLGRG
jgi:hypothetical protein